MRISAAFLLCLGVAVAPLPGAAQDYTTDELRALFEAQRDAFREIEKSGGQKTRGLTMVTVEDMAADPAGTETAANRAGTVDATTETSTLTSPGTDTQTTIIAETTATETEMVPQPVMFGQFAPELQVNVRIEFDFDSAALSAEQKPKLAQLCSVMKTSDIGLFRIVGHTDTSGTDAYNEKLSLLRAEEVKRYFTGECGIDAARLEAIGLGERFPYNAEDTKAGENRRVEFQAMS